jgi:tRNA 2-thiouridine synthesizing protein E
VQHREFTDDFSTFEGQTMHTTQTAQHDTYRTLSLLMDDEGFLINPEHWNAELATELANAAGIDPLQDTHWEAIEYLRDKVLKLGALPPMRRVCRHLGVDKHQVKSLFGGCRQLWQIAGLPNPGEEARAYMD